MSSSSSSSSGGIGVLGLLGVVFVTLKLTGFIDWSWWWVTMPFWGVFGLIFGGMFVVFIGWLVIALSKDAINKNKRRSNRMFKDKKRKKITFGK